MNSKAEALQKLIDSKDPLKKNSEVLNSIFSKIDLLKGDTGPQGEPGYSPIKGTDYFTESEINFFIQFVQSKVTNGVDGKDGKDGIHGYTPIRGIDYWSPKDQEKILQSVLAKVPVPKDGISPKIEDIVAKVHEETKKNPLHLNDIKGTAELIEFLKRGGFRGGGGGITLTTTGTSGAATLVNGVLNIPQYSGGGGTPALPFNSIQFNNAGAFGGNAKLTYNASTNVFLLGTTPSSSDYIANWAPNANLQASFGTNATNILTAGTNTALIAIAPVLTQNTLTDSGFTAFTVNPEITGSSATMGFMQGAYYSMTYSGTGTVTGGVFGNQVEANVVSGTVDEMGAMLMFNVMSGGTVTNSKAAYITDVAKSGGTLTNNYGVWIADILVGTNNWAIKTNAGKIELGSAPSGTGFGQTYRTFASIGYDQTNPLVNTTDQYGTLLISNTLTQNTNQAGNVIAGMIMDFTVNGSGNFSDVQGNVNGATYAGSGTIDGVFGAQNFAQLSSGTATSGLYGGFFSNYMTGGTAGTSYGVYIDSTSKSGGTLTNEIGLFINDIVAGSTTNRAIQTGLGKILFADLAGTGNRMVIASSTGQLSTQAITTGTVTAVSVASANGFAGSSSGGATPALTLSTTITGVLKGNGTAISAATAGTDYAVGSTGLAGGQTIAGGTLTTQNLTLRGNAADTTTGSVAITTSTASTTKTTGALTVAGGLGVAGAINANSMTLTSGLPVASGGTGGTAASITLFNNITGFTAAGATGTTSTNLVFSTSPTLVTPVLGVATATTINKVTLTTPATGSTLTIADGKTVTANVSPTFSGADMTFTGSGAIVTTFPVEATTLLGRVGNDRKTGQTAAVNLATYTVGASDATYFISANVLVTTSTLHNFTVTCSYTDEGNTARTLTLTFSNVGGTLVSAITNTGGTVPYEGVPLHIRCKAATTIIIGSAAGGTYTTVTYNIEERIVKVE